MIRLGIFGRGRLGSAIAQAAAETDGWRLVWHVGRTDPPPPGTDVAIDASTADGVPGHLDWALATGTDLVIGATGWELPDLADRVANRIGVLVAPNFSLGAALLLRLAGVLARWSASRPDHDLFLIEHHHRLKADSPSGTARALARTLVANCPRLTGWREGTPDAGELGVGVVRAGAEFGTHTVGLDSPHEQITLTHRARSRSVFAAGALHGARWIHGRRGVFPFTALAAETLTPLFTEFAEDHHV